MAIVEKLKALGYDLTTPAPALASYVPYILAEKTLYVSGQIPMKDGVLTCAGQVGDTVSVEEAVKAAQLCAVNILNQVHDAVGGDWARVKRCIKLGGFVNCAAGFTAHSNIINGASDLIVNVMGDAGKHARFAVGASSLPLGAAVEIEAVFELS